MNLDFNDIEKAFAYKSDKELKKTYRMFKLMSYSWLVNMGSSVLVGALNLRLPLVRSIVKNTIFDEFVGGISLEDSQKSIDKLYAHKVLTVLDYGTERLSTEKDFNAVREELLRAVEFAAVNDAIPVVAIKLTALTFRDLLKKMSAGETLSSEEEDQKKTFINRVDSICGRAAEKGVSIFIDAEESWIQDAIDYVVIEMSKKYNKNHIVVFHTYQMYRKGMIDNMIRDHKNALADGYILGAKVVRGAYMEKERERAQKMGYEDPINPDKEATDKMFNDAMRYCVENYETMASCCATHNVESSMLYASLIDEKGIDKNFYHLTFAQLYGMSDAISFNLALQGFNVAKYLPYGEVKEVIPYLIRRAEENTTVTGDMGRELGTILKEMKRRGLA